jgi:hypothetical protein
LAFLVAVHAEHGLHGFFPSPPGVSAAATAVVGAAAAAADILAIDGKKRSNCSHRRTPSAAILTISSLGWQWANEGADWLSTPSAVVSLQFRGLNKHDVKRSLTSQNLYAAIKCYFAGGQLWKTSAFSIIWHEGRS